MAIHTPDTGEAGNDVRPGVRPRAVGGDHPRTSGTLLLLDGALLSVIAATQVVLQLVGYYEGAGPLGGVVQGSPHVIGWVESYGLALVLGVLLMTTGRHQGGATWHRVALSVHLLLAAANVVFWESFVAFGMMPAGAAATAAHVLFILAHARYVRAKA